MSARDLLDQELERACEQAANAGAALRARGPHSRAAVLRAIASDAREVRTEILSVAAGETALTPEELSPEFDRMVSTLDMFAALIEDGSWVRAALDPAAPRGTPTIGPNHDVRRMLAPLGDAVAVFGASNFPLAYGVCGGDTASALAAGCGVIVKEHPAHPWTGRTLAKLAADAAARAGAPRGLIGYILDPDSDFDIGRRLVQSPSICAVGFTGSVGGGLAIERFANERPARIPVFAEMGSSNIVLVTRDAATERPGEIADALTGSILSRFGQQCTNTGLILIDQRGASRTERTQHPIIDQLKRALLEHGPRDMLSSRVRDTYQHRLDDLDTPYAAEGVVHRRATEPIGERGAFPALVESDHAELKFNEPRYRDEIFGPACIVASIDLDDPARLDEILLGLNRDAPWSNLVTSVYLGKVPRPADITAAQRLARFTGRIVFNGPPTGVRVAAGMVHGGPFPATNRPDTTAVGPLAIERWCRPVCFQNCPDALLPPELQNANPLGILRQVNGQFTRDPICP